MIRRRIPRDTLDDFVALETPSGLSPTPSTKTGQLQRALLLPRPGATRGLQVSRRHVLQDLLLQRQLRDQAPELGVLQLQRFEPLRHRNRDLVGVEPRRSSDRTDIAARAQLRDRKPDYFLFAFGLFGSTVLLPEMLQTLFGCTATDAGLALGPGAAAVTLMAPFVMQIVQRVGAKRLLAFRFTVPAPSFFYYSGIRLRPRLTISISRSHEPFRASVTPS